LDYKLQFHHGNRFLLLYTVALVYSMQETTAVVELWACNTGNVIWRHVHNGAI